MVTPELSWGSEETGPLIMDGLLGASEKISQPRYQVRVNSQINVLVNNKSVIYKVKCFSEIIKSVSKRGVAFVQVAVYDQLINQLLWHPEGCIGPQ